MKKSIAILLTLCLCVGLCACSVEIPKFTVEEFTNALLSKDIEFDNSTISPTGDFLFYSDHHIVSGTADKNQNVTYAMLVNMGVDASVFDNQAKFETWLAETAEMDIGSSSLREIDKLIATQNCIDELMAFYELANGEDEPFDFAEDALLRKKSTIVDGWKIKVSVNSKDNMLITEIISKGASASANPFAAVDELLFEVEYQQMIDTLSTDPATPYAFFLENKYYKDCAQYLEKFKPFCTAKKYNGYYTDLKYENGLLIKEETDYENGCSNIVYYTYTDDGVLAKKLTEFKSNTSHTITSIEYDAYGNPVLENIKYKDGTGRKITYENTYDANNNLKNCKVSLFAVDLSGQTKTMSIQNTNYTENGGYETIYETSTSNDAGQIVRCDEHGNVIYMEYRYLDGKSNIYQYEYEYDSNGNVLYKRTVGEASYSGYEYNKDGTLAYTYHFDGTNVNYNSEVWYEYTYIYQE